MIFAVAYTLLALPLGRISLLSSTFLSETIGTITSEIISVPSLETHDASERSLIHQSFAL